MKDKNKKVELKNKKMDKNRKVREGLQAEIVQEELKVEIVQEELLVEVVQEVVALILVPFLELHKAY